MPVEHIGGVAGGNATITIPTQSPNDVIILTTLRPGTVVPAATTGFASINAVVNVGLNDVCRALIEWRTCDIGSTSIPPNSAGGSISRIAEVYRGLAFNPLPTHDLTVTRSDVSPGSENELIFRATATDAPNEWLFSVVLFAGDPTDETDPPAGLTLRHTLGTAVRVATYDSNGESLELSYTGSPFAINRRWATLTYHLFPFMAATLNQRIEDITFESSAMLERVANLNQTIENITLESEAHIPPSTDAHLDQTVAFITLASTATITQPEPIVCTPDPAPVINSCVSVVNHAVYTSFRLYDVLQNALFPAIRESNPMTAFDTMDDWLDRLNWVDCMGACRMPGINGILPTEIVGECGSYEADLIYPACLVDTIKHGIIAALTRMQYGRTKNLCAVNEIIAPLGAVVFPTAGQEDECPHKMTIAPYADDIETWQRLGCNAPMPSTCAAYYVPTPDDPPGLPSRIYPGLMAAECIVRSMFTQHNFIDFTRLIAVPGAIPNCSSLDL